MIELNGPPLLQQALPHRKFLHLDGRRRYSYPAEIEWVGSRSKLLGVEL